VIASGFPGTGHFVVDKKKEPQDDPDRREAIADVDEQLEAEADGDGLAAEAGRGEETGLAEG
jgi:hypothetical protein